jgi:hypothetical protein
VDLDDRLIRMFRQQSPSKVRNHRRYCTGGDVLEPEPAASAVFSNRRMSLEKSLRVVEEAPFRFRFGTY